MQYTLLFRGWKYFLIQFFNQVQICKVLNKLHKIDLKQNLIETRLISFASALIINKH